MTAELWQRCLKQLEGTVPEQHMNMWIRPLQVSAAEDAGLRLLAPNRFVLDWVQDNYLSAIETALAKIEGHPLSVSIGIGSSRVSRNRDNGRPAVAPRAFRKPGAVVEPPQPATTSPSEPRPQPDQAWPDGLNHAFLFDSFVEGKSNQIAHAAAIQVAEHPGAGYNPLFIYGGVGLGKTHLMQAVGNAMRLRRSSVRIAYVHSERFVGDMVRALQQNTINEFKRHYRSVDALLIDDIQFFSGKDRSQEEFFHTFNTLLETEKQVIMTCDRYPKEVDGVEERLRSRFGWGLTVAIEPPELETRAAILSRKASEADFLLPDDVAFFIAQRIRSNVRELEGALKRVMANARFTGRPTSVEFAREALKDILALQQKLVTIENIQKTVAEYYQVRVSDLHSKRRSRSVTRPRQVAMALSKELTNHSLPEIGDAFGGRDHTTVLHACRKVRELRDIDSRIGEDYKNLLRTLQS